MVPGVHEVSRRDLGVAESGGDMSEDRIIATFNAYDYDEATDHANLYKYIGALLAIRERVRSWRKHGHDFKSADAALDEVYALIIDEMQGLKD